MIRVISALILGATLTISLSAQQPPASKTIPAPDDVAKPPADAVTTPSGVASKVLQPGKGTTKPAATDLITVHYTGWTTDGKMFDSSVAAGKPVTDRKSTRLNSSHSQISYAVFCLKKKKDNTTKSKKQR